MSQMPPPVAPSPVKVPGAGCMSGLQLGGVLLVGGGVAGCMAVGGESVVLCVVAEVLGVLLIAGSEAAYWILRALAERRP